MSIVENVTTHITPLAAPRGHHSGAYAGHADAHATRHGGDTHADDADTGRGELTASEIRNPALSYALWMLQNRYLSIDVQGHIWRNAIINHRQWKFLSTPRRAENVGGKGYLRLTLQIKGKLHSVMAHHVVWYWHGKEIPPGMEINHKDLIKQNNQYDNLEVTNGSGNMQHAYAHERARPWSINRDSAVFWRKNRLKLAQNQIEEAREMRKQRFALKVIAKHLNISITHAHRITQDVL